MDPQDPFGLLVQSCALCVINDEQSDAPQIPPDPSEPHRFDQSHSPPSPSGPSPRKPLSSPKPPGPPPVSKPPSTPPGPPPISKPLSPPLPAGAVVCKPLSLPLPAGPPQVSWKPLSPPLPPGPPQVSRKPLSPPLPPGPPPLHAWFDRDLRATASQVAPSPVHPPARAPPLSAPKDAACLRFDVMPMKRDFSTARSLVSARLLYKTTECTTWIDGQGCRYGPKCRFRHPYESKRQRPTDAEIERAVHLEAWNLFKKRK